MVSLVFAAAEWPDPYISSDGPGIHHAWQEEDSQQAKACNQMQFIKEILCSLLK